MDSESAPECSGFPVWELVCTLGQHLPGPIQWAFYFAVSIAIWFIVAEWRLLGQPGNPAFQKQINRIRAKAEGVSVADRYRDGLQSLLNAIDRLFGQTSEAVPGSIADRWFGCQPWTALSYERLLNLACVYPIVFLIVGATVYRNESEVARAAILVGPVLGYTIGLATKRRFEQIQSRKLRIFVSFIGVALVFPIGIASASSVINSVAAMVVFACAVAFACAFAGASAVAVVVTTVIIAVVVSAEFAYAYIAGFVLVLLSILVISTIYKSGIRVSIFWLISTLIVIAAGLIAATIENHMAPAVLYLLYLPISNALLDWLSLGVTRGLLIHITRGRQKTLTTLIWALVDIILALVLLAGVAFSSFLAYWLARTISPNQLVTVSQLRDIAAGGHLFSISIWLMLASTLLPTFLHFLVALLAFVSLPFSRERASDTANQLQLARNEALRRESEKSYQAASDTPVDAYARRWAMAYFGVSTVTVVILWLALVSFLSYIIYKIMQWMFVTLLA